MKTSSARAEPEFLEAFRRAHGLVRRTRSRPEAGALRVEACQPVAAGQAARAPTRAVFWPVAVLAGLAILARGSLQWPLPLAQCWWRRITGIPCPTCGCTRSLAACTRLDFEQAFFFNPLFFILCVALVCWSVAGVVGQLTGRPLLPDLRPVASRGRLWKLGVVLLGLNWVYLWLRLPK